MNDLGRCVPEQCFKAGDVEVLYPERRPTVEFDPVTRNAPFNAAGYDGGVCNSWTGSPRSRQRIHASGLLCVSDCTCPDGEYCASWLSTNSCRFMRSPYMRCVPRQCRDLGEEEPDKSSALQWSGDVVFDTRFVVGTPRTLDGGACTEFPKGWFEELKDAGRDPSPRPSGSEFEGLPLNDP